MILVRYPGILKVPASSPSRCALRLPISSRYLSLSSKMSSPASGPKYFLNYYVPKTHVMECNEAIFAVGAGTYPGGQYSRCWFEVRGIGHFHPNQGATPAIGEVGADETVDEVKVEVICMGKECVEAAVKELKRAHPYEVVAYQVIKVEDI